MFRSVIGLVCLSCLLLTGCAAAYVKPPYAEEGTSKTQCQPKNGSSTDDCKQSPHN